MNIYSEEKTIFDFAHPIQQNDNPYYGYVYFSFNLINGKKYIGQSGKKFNGKYFGSGRDILRALRKYGNQNFLVKVIEWCDHKESDVDSKNFLDERETFWIRFFNAKHEENYYNVISTATPALRGKENGFYRKKHSIESLEKAKQTNANKTKEQKLKERDRHRNSLKMFYNSQEGILLKESIGNRNRNKKQPKEVLEKRKFSVQNRSDQEKEIISKKLSESLREFYQSEKGVLVREKMSADRTGRKMPEGFSEAASKRLKGIPKTKEHIDKINKNPEKIRKTAEKHKGMKRTEETRNNISASKIGKPAKNKGEVWYHDPINKLNKQFNNGQIPPKDWIKGTGRKVFHDPETFQNYTCWEGEQLDNWARGRYIRKK